MGLFMPVESENAVLIENGVYKQVPVYTRNGYIYAKLGSGYVKLNVDGSTSKPKCKFDTITWEGQLGSDPMGRLCDPLIVPGSKAVHGSIKNKLLGIL